MRLMFAAFAAVMLMVSSANGQAINEIRISEPGADANNFFEVAGNPGDSLAGLSLITVSAEFNPGLIEAVFDLSTFSIPADGFFLGHQTDTTADLLTGVDFFGSPTNFLLVDGFSGMASDDLDTDDDGVIDGTTPWTNVVDGVLLIDGDANTDFLYGSLDTVGPDGDFTPAHIYRDTDITGNWQIGSFGDFSNDTAGFSNEAAVPEPGSATVILGLGVLALVRRKRS